MSPSRKSKKKPQKSSRKTEKKSSRRIAKLRKKPASVREAAIKTDLDYMKIALDEMTKSRSEHGFSKTDPLVGAVLVAANGKELGRAHRGNYAAGDHGEFTLLKKKLKGTDARGSSIFVTLEPCSTRNPPKLPCAHRIVESGIARAVIGIKDPNPQIFGNGERYLREHGVKVEFFPTDLANEIRRQNRSFLTQYENPPKKEGERQTEFQVATFEETAPVPHTDVNDLSKEAIWKYLESCKLNLAVPSDELWSHFLKLGFLVQNPEGQLIPTTAGMVVFGENPDRFISQCKIKADRLVGTPGDGTLPEQVAGDGQAEITGPLSRVIDEVERFFNRHVAKVPRIEGSKRVYVPEYPWRAVREAVVNALVHRSYRAGLNIVFRMYRDRIVIKSPGLPPNPLTLEKIRSGDAESYRRNPRIADSAFQLRYMEERGNGIPAMRKLLSEHGLAEPQFDEEAGFFVVTLPGRELAPIEIKTSREILAQLNSRQEQLLKVLDAQKKMAPIEWAEKAGISRPTANLDFRRLASLGLVEKKGKGRSTYYVLK